MTTEEHQFRWRPLKYNGVNVGKLLVPVPKLSGGGEMPKDQHSLPVRHLVMR